MKKGLSALLAASLAFSAFGSVAFAADKELTAQEKFEALVEAGIFDKDGDGTGSNLEGLTTRAQVAKILVTLLGLKENAAGEKFDDVTDADWYAGYIGALQAAKLVDGVSDNPPLFAPDDNVTVEQFAKLVAIALNLPIDEDAEVEGEVSDWAVGYVAAVVKAGYLAAQEDYTTEATRQVLVESAFDAKTILDQITSNSAVSDVKAVGAKKIEVTFNKAVDTSKATFKVLRGAVAQNIDSAIAWNDAKTVATITMNVKFQKDEYTVQVGGVVESVYEKKLSLEEEKIVSIEFIGDNASYVRNTKNNTLEGYYNVYNQYKEAVNGTAVNFNASKGQINGSDGKFTITTATVGNPDGIPYQLNENVIVSAYYSDYSTGSFAQAQKTLTVAQEAKVASLEIQGLYHASNDLPTVGETPSDFEVKFVAKDQYGRVVKDKDIIKDDIQVFANNPSIFTVGTNAADFRVSSGVAYVKLAPANGETTFTRAGLNGITMYAISSGGNAKLDVTVGDSQKVDTFTLNAPDIAVGNEKIEIPFTAVDKAGKTLGTAADFNLLNSTISLSSTFDVNGQPKKIYFEKDVVNNKTKLFLDATGKNVTKDVPVVAYINATVNPNTIDYKLVSLNLTLKPDAVPYTITGLKDTKVAMVDKATTSVEHDDIVVVDQYNRTYAIKDKLANYNVKVSLASNSYVKQTSVASADEKTAIIDTNVKSLPLEAVAKGSVDLTLTVIDLATNKTIDSTAKTVKIRVVEPKDVVDFEIADVAKLYAYDTGSVPTFVGAQANYSKALSVTGLLADGTKVAIKTDDARLYTVSGATYGVTYDNGKLTATAQLKDAGNALKDSANATGKVVVSVTKSGDTTFVEKEISLSKADPVATTFEVRTNGVATKQGTDYVSVTKGAGALSADFDKITLAQNAVNVKDQYGVSIITEGTKFTNVTLAQLVDEKGERVKVGGNYVTGDDILAQAKVGDTFQVSVFTKAGNPYTFKVIVK